MCSCTAQASAYSATSISIEGLRRVPATAISIVGLGSSHCDCTAQASADAATAIKYYRAHASADSATAIRVVGLGQVPIRRLPLSLYGPGQCLFGDCH